MEALPQHAIGLPAHGMTRSHLAMLGVAVLVVVAGMAVVASPAIVTWRAKAASPPVPAIFQRPPSDHVSIGGVSIDEPVAAVFGAMGSPTSSVAWSPSRVEHTWLYEGARVKMVTSTGVVPVVLSMDYRVTDDAIASTVLQDGIRLGRTPIAALVRAWGKPADSGVPTPTSVRYVACRASTGVVIEVDDGTWSTSLHPVARHVNITAAGDTATTLC